MPEAVYILTINSGRKTMSDLLQLQPLLNKLKLSGISEIIEDVTKQALQEKWSYSQLLLHLFSTEVDRRKHNQNNFRLAKSNLDPTKSLELFQFSFNKNIPQRVIKELGQCQFINQHENVFFVGSSGVGKTHLANGIGIEACRRGYDVLFKRTSNLLDWLHSGYGDGSFDKKMKRIIKIPLLILDDFGLIPLNKNYQVYLYEIISERYEIASTMITSNRDFSEWIDVFDNPLMGSAAMDRLVHKAIKITIPGDSFRTYQFKMNQKKIFNIDNKKQNK
jgi:DNA replication protein DnaC